MSADDMIRSSIGLTSVFASDVWRKQHLTAIWIAFMAPPLDGRGHRIASATSCSSLRSSMAATSVTLAFPN
jgi:hypothetical protein